MSTENYSNLVDEIDLGKVEHYLDVCDGVNMKNYYSVTYLDKLNRKHTISFDYIHDLFEFIFHHTTNNKNNV